MHVCLVNIFDRALRKYPFPAPLFLFNSSRCLRCLASAAAFFRCRCACTEWSGYMTPLCRRTLCLLCSIRREDTGMSNTCLRVLRSCCWNLCAVVVESCKTVVGQFLAIFEKQLEFNAIFMNQ